MGREPLRFVRHLVTVLIAVGAAALAAAQSEPPARPEQPAEAAPAEVVERLHSGLVELAMRSGDAPLEARVERLRPLVTATHDIRYIAELTIRRTWDELPPEDRARFVDAFERLSVATYASRFSDLDSDPFRIVESTVPEGGRAQVGAEIERPDAEPVPLEYVLHETDAGWRIVNIVADGVSDLALKRAEYRRILEDGTIDDLIAQLRSQVEDLR